MSALSKLSYKTIFITAIINFFFGFLWYGILFTQEWSSATGITIDSQKPNLKMMAGAFITSLVTMFGISILLRWSKKSGFISGILLGLIISIFFILTGHSGLYIMQHNLKLYLLTAGYQAIAITIMAGIIGTFQK